MGIVSKIVDCKLKAFIREIGVLASFYDYKTMKDKKFLIYDINYSGVRYEVRLGGECLLTTRVYEEAMVKYNEL